MSAIKALKQELADAYAEIGRLKAELLEARAGDGDRLVSTEWIAEQTGFAERTIKAKITAGEIEGIATLKGEYRVKRAAYLAWLDENTVEWDDGSGLARQPDQQGDFNDEATDNRGTPRRDRAARQRSIQARRVRPGPSHQQAQEEAQDVPEANDSGAGGRAPRRADPGDSRRAPAEAIETDRRRIRGKVD